MLICKTNLQNWTSILNSDGENCVSPKPDGHTYRHTDGRTDISVYRVASLLKTGEGGPMVCQSGYFSIGVSMAAVVAALIYLNNLVQNKQFALLNYAKMNAHPLYLSC